MYLCLNKWARPEYRIDAIINFKLHLKKTCYWIHVHILYAESNNQICCCLFVIKTCFGLKICVSNCNLHAIPNWIWLWYFALWWTLASTFEISWSVYILYIVYEEIELQHKCIKWEFLNVWFVNSFIIVSSRNLRFYNTQVVFILRR